MKSFIFSISVCGCLLLTSCEGEKENKKVIEMNGNKSAEFTVHQDSLTNKNIIIRNDGTQCPEIDLNSVPSTDLSCDSTNTNNINSESVEIKDFDKLFTFSWNENRKTRYAQQLISIAMPVGMPYFDIKPLKNEIIKTIFGKSYNSVENALSDIRKYNNIKSSKLINDIPDNINLTEVEQKNTNGTLIDIYYDILCYQIKFTSQTENEFSEETILLNYDLQQGKILTFDDFFRSDKKSQAISEITKHAQGGRYSFDKEKAPANLFFQKNAIYIIYNISEVNSPDGIAPLITIPLSIMKPYMTDFAITRFKL